MSTDNENIDPAAQAAAPGQAAPVPEEPTGPEELVPQAHIGSGGNISDVNVNAPSSVPTTEQTRPVFFEKDKFDVNGLTLDVPNQHIAETDRLLSEMPNIDYRASKDGRELIQHLSDANYAIYHKDWLVGATKRLGSKWVQEIPGERGPLMGTVPQLRDIPEGRKLTGEAAMLQVRSAMGLGTRFKVPLYHTGIWMTFKAPKDAAILELNRRLTEEKVRLGRQTHGLAYANNSVFFAAILSEFAIDHIYDSNMQENDKEWDEIISVLDLPIMIWAIAYCVWPSGFQYARAILDPVTGGYTREEALMKLGAMQWDDLSSFTPRQVAHMSKQTGKVVSLETKRLYQEEFLRGQERKVTVNDRLEVVLGVPTIRQYINNGSTWVNNIITMVDRAFAMPPGDERRHQYIMEHGRATNVRQFGHWVKQVIVDGKDTVDDDEDISNALDDISADDDVMKRFFKEVQTYVEDSTVSMIAMPLTSVGEKSSVMKQFPDIVPMDVMSSFFILQYQKVQMLALRQ